MFLSNATTDRSPAGEFWFSPVPFRAGGPVTADQAIRLAAVFACVRIIAEDIAKLPFALMRPRRGEPGRDAVLNHWLYTLIARRPNAWQNPFEFREFMQACISLRGEAFARIIATARGVVTDLIPIHNDRVKIEMIANDNWRYRVRNRDGTEAVLVRGEMFHPKSLSLDGIRGVSPIQAASETVALALAAQRYGTRFFDNDAKPGGWIEYPGQFPDKEARDNFRVGWQEQQTGEHRGKVAVLEFGMKFHEVGITNEDSQFLETRQMQVGEIARLFRMPPHKIGDLSRATNNNIEHQGIEYVTDCLAPNASRLEAAIAWNFLPDEGPDAELDVEFSMRALMRGDTKARSLYASSGINSGWLTRNEARDDDGRNPIDGLDEPLQPLNMATSDQADAAWNDNPNDAGTDTDPADDKSAHARARAVLQAQDANARVRAQRRHDRVLAACQPDPRLLQLAIAGAERVARKEAEFARRVMRSDSAVELETAYEKHAAFVAAALGVSDAAATAYCARQVALLQGKGATMEIAAFEEIARARLERLAVTGDGQ